MNEIPGDFFTDSSEKLSAGAGRTRIDLDSIFMGKDLVVRIFNSNAHVGAIALGEYDHQEKRASVSCITRFGHKDDIIARETAHTLSKAFKINVCVLAGVHLDNITNEEIEQILENVSSLVNQFKDNNSTQNRMTE